MNGRRNRHGDRPAAFITMTSESVDRRLSVCVTARSIASGAMISASTGIARPVMPMNTSTVCPCAVIRSIPRNACVTQITPVSDTSTIRNDSSVNRTT